MDAVSITAFASIGVAVFGSIVSHIVALNSVKGKVEAMEVIQMERYTSIQKEQDRQFEEILRHLRDIKDRMNRYERIIETDEDPGDCD